MQSIAHIYCTENQITLTYEKRFTHPCVRTTGVAGM
jgi:hypothetical protein